MTRSVSPDESLIGDGGARRPEKDVIAYPLGDYAPAPGELIDLGSGVRWTRMPLSGALGHINLWIVDDRDEQGDGVAIIDTGMATDGTREAWRALLSGPLAGVRVTRVIVTHYHADHIGMAGWLCEHFGVDLWMTREEWMLASLMAADVRPAPPSAAVAYWRFAGWDDDRVAQGVERGWGSYARIVTPVPISHYRISAGDVLDFAGEKWRVVVGRGHAPEHACLLHERAGLMIAGDQILPTISSNVSVQVNEPMADPLGHWLASIDRLMGLPEDLLVLPSHGKPFTGVRARLTALRDRHRERLDLLIDHLAEPRRVVDCFPKLFRREIKGFDLFPATGEALAHLRRLECEGRVRRTIDDDGVGWFSAIN